MTTKQDLWDANGRLQKEIVHEARAIPTYEGESAFYGQVIAELDALADRIWEIASPHKGRQ